MFWCEVGDLVQVKQYENDVFICDPWIGICTWIGGHKYSFLIEGTTETWTSHDLTTVRAEVIGK